MKITKTELLKGYEIIKKVIDYKLQKNSVEFITSELAPNTYKGMREYFDEFGQFLIYSGEDHGFLGQEYNIKFRALHDYMHYNYNLSFKFEDEKKLSEITEKEFMYDALKVNATLQECLIVANIINAEIKGQIEYYEKNNEYVKNQAEFIESYLKVVA